jgi:TnpA family transposase
VWGSGTSSSSDGQFFRGAKRGASGGDINARYGVDHGFSFYTHNSDQRAPYNVNIISAATHEAPYVLDGLLHHGSGLEIGTHYTDTGGATAGLALTSNATTTTGATSSTAQDEEEDRRNRRARRNLLL